MQALTYRSELAVLQQPQSHPALPRMSQSSFEHYLNVLFVQSKVLASNVISLHLHLAGRTAGQEEGPVLLSRLQLDLQEQASEIQAQLISTGSMCVQPQDWGSFAALWRIPNVGDVPAALALVLEATDLLTALYESLLPLAAEKHDQGSALYLLADHLDVLNSNLSALKDWHMLQPA